MGKFDGKYLMTGNDNLEACLKSMGKLRLKLYYPQDCQLLRTAGGGHQDVPGPHRHQLLHHEGEGDRVRDGDGLQGPAAVEPDYNLQGDTCEYCRKF